MKLFLVRHSSEYWGQCVSLVRQRYASAFGADVHPEPDAFLAARAASGASRDVLACAGFTFGSGQTFFSERYLDGRVESYVAQHSQHEIERTHIVEVGALAGASGSGHELIRVTPVIAWCLGMRYILCTATAPLVKTFERLQIPFTPFTRARPERLDPLDRSRWGQYYEADPTTGVIPLTDIAPLFAGATGRYSFADPEVTLLAGAKRSPRLSAVGGGLEGP